MTARRTLLVDAFTEEPLAGNVAGVLPDADGLSDDQMARIAAELGASETAFLTTADDEDVDRRIRYFTPTTEVDLCGHATIASYAALFSDGDVSPGVDVLGTNVGDLRVRVTHTGRVWMTQGPPSVRRVDIEYDELGTALGIDPAALRDVGADLPVAVASTGLPFLVVPVNFLEGLGGMTPDEPAVVALSETHDVAGVYAFTFDTLEAESTLHGRAFAPVAGVSEDPVTGTASGACGAYLHEFDVFDGDPPDRLRFEQGHFLDRPGLVHVRVDGDEVRVGGDAVVSLRGELQPPNDDPDEILEV